MSLPKLLKSIGEKTPAEVKEELLNFYSSMSPEVFSEHIKNSERLAENRGREKEREEIICQLLASGMTVEEVAVILCIKKDIIHTIEKGNATQKIPEYAKKINLRRKRRERQSQKL